MTACTRGEGVVGLAPLAKLAKQGGVCAHVDRYGLPVAVPEVDVDQQVRTAEVLGLKT